jgi:outer membrane protein assembly factor BamB
MAGVLRRSPVLAVLAAAALAGCVDTSSPREDGLFWWPATGPDQPDQPTAPVLLSLTPSSAFAGDPAFVLTVTGTRFQDGAQVTWSGSPRPTTYVSATTLRAQISAADVAVESWPWVGVTNPDGAVSNTYGFGVTRAVPWISGLTPSGVAAGDPGFVLTVSGTGFQNGSRVMWTGVARPTTYLSPTTLRATIAAADVATAGWASVRVENPGGEASWFTDFAVYYPTPTITSLSPAVAPQGGGGFVLTVSGGPFAWGSKVTWNGAWRSTTVVSSSVLQAEIFDTDVATPGSALVAVDPPSPNTGRSAAVTIPVMRPSPTVTAMSPASIAPGSPSFTLTVAGSGFLPGTVVRWNGAARPTRVASSTVLHATIDPGDVASAGAVEVSVYTAPPDGGVASAGTFTIAAASPRAPQAVTYQVDPAHSGSVDLGAPLAFPADPAWVATLADVSSYPLIADGRVYLLSRGSSAGWYGTQLYALDLATGATVWGPLDIPGTYFWSAHAFDGGRLFVVSYDAVLTAFDAATGAEAWSVTVPGGYAEAAPTATGGVVYVAAGSMVSALAASDGRLLWSTYHWSVGQSSPTVTTDGLFVSTPCAIEKLDLLSGTPIWTATAGCQGGIAKTTAFADGALYLREYTASALVGAVHDGFDGTVVGAFGTPSRSSLAIPAVAARRTFLVSATGYQSGYALQALDRSGGVAWTFSGDGQLHAAPLVIGDVVLTGSGAGTVYAVDAGSGTQTWSASAGAAIPFPDEWNVSQPLTGLAAGEGYLVVPAGRRIVAWQLVP